MGGEEEKEVEDSLITFSPNRMDTEEEEATVRLIQGAAENIM